jgi:hypothetical protein
MVSFNALAAVIANPWLSTVAFAEGLANRHSAPTVIAQTEAVRMTLLQKTWRGMPLEMPWFPAGFTCWCRPAEVSAECESRRTPQD